MRPTPTVAELMQAHGPAIARLAALYEFDASEREDLVQEIWLAVWRALPGFRGDSSVRTFLFRIAHNRAVSHVQRRARAMKPTSDDTAQIADPQAGPERRAEAADTVWRLFAALAGMPLVDRQLVQLSLEGLRQGEIAEVLGITENNVAVRLSRARGRLRELMETDL